MTIHVPVVVVWVLVAMYGVHIAVRVTYLVLARRARRDLGRRP